MAHANGDVVQFHFAARAGVCGDGRGMLRIEGGFWSTSYGNFNDMPACVSGPVRAVIAKDGGEVIRIQTVAGPLTPAADVTDLGAVSANEAAKYFVDLARKLEGRPARSAVLAAALADSADIYQLRSAIISALATDGSKPALDKLLAIAQSNVEARVRKLAVTKLSESGDPRAKALLQSIVDR